MYVIARNAKGRPMLMHRLDILRTRTLCGIDISSWSRSYHDSPISTILCKKCGKTS